MWKPIEKYDKLKNKPKHCIFWVEELKHERDYLYLPETISTERRMGSRNVTHYKVVTRPDSLVKE